jgi:hypothetical protein
VVVTATVPLCGREENLLLGRCSSARQTEGAVVVTLRFALSGGAMSNLLLACFLKLSNNRGLIAEAA